MTPRRLTAAFLALAASLAVPAVAMAHPLGNFTINHYAGIRVAADVIRLDVVIDMAEIPTFQERQRIDRDGDGSVGSSEIAAERAVACQRLAPSLSLAIGGARQDLVTEKAGLTFPPGAAELVTMRLVCEYDARLAAPLSDETEVTFSDVAFAERIGWREIVVQGDGVTLAASGVPSASVSDRLTHYPSDLLSQPLDMRSAAFAARPGGPTLPAWSAPDAGPIDGSAGATQAMAGPAGDPGPADPTASRAAGAVPGGIGGELASFIGTKDMSVPAIMVALLIALGLGAVHALSPGHGKTVMAAYLVGSRGTARHALGLGLTVTVSHTLGVLALAAVTLLASSFLPPERLYPVLGLASGGIVVAIGGWLLLARYREWVAGRPHGRSDGHEHTHTPGESHDNDETASHPHEHPESGAHSYGGHEHSHLPPAGARLSWRGLFALGLAGGLVPSASALILLLGSIAAGRLELGVVLVVAFGAGMAVVLGGVGLALVYAGRLFERLPSSAHAARLGRALPTATAVVVLVAGLVLTGQAVTQVF
jgi:ABC-type nickel/cobalt efflux system permease component RcnA